MQATSPRVSPAPAPQRRLKLLVAGGAIVLGITYLIVTALQTSTVYYVTVGELLQRGAQAQQTQQVRVAGDVVPGSVEKVDAGLAIRFQVHDGSGQMPVYYKGGPVPDIFGEEVQVVVEGKVGADGTFQASTLLAKCPSKFETAGAADA